MPNEDPPPAGSPRERIEQLTQQLENNPDDTEAILERARLWNQLQDYPRALEDYDAYIETASDPDASAYLSRGTIRHTKTSDTKGAIDDFTRYIELKPDDARGYAYRATAYRAVDDTEKALDDLEKALDLDPNNAIALHGLAKSLCELFRLDDGLAIYERLLQVNPAPGIFFERGDLLFAMGNAQAAAEDFSAAIAIDDTKVKYYVERAACYKQLDEHDLAIQDYVRITQLDRENETIISETLGTDAVDVIAEHVQELMMNFEDDQDDEAIAYVTSLIDQYPLNEKLNARLLAFRARRRGFQMLEDPAFANNVVDDCTKSIELAPDFSDAYSTRAEAYRELERFDEAIKDYDEAIQRSEGDLFPLLDSRGCVRIQQQDFKGALSDFREATAQLADRDLRKYEATRLVAMRFNRGGCFLALGDLQRATEEFNECVTLDRGHETYETLEPLAIYWRGHALFTLGQHKDAQADSKRAGELDEKLRDRPYEDVDVESFPFQEWGI